MNSRILGKPKPLSLPARPRAGFAVRIAVALGCGILAAANDAALATTLDGTSGTNTSNAALSTTGNLQIDLGFFSEYLVVGGGGGGGSNPYSAGGGGGGLLTNVNGTPLQLGAGTFTVTVGAGGIGQANGQNSVFDSLTAVGGGHGGMHATGTSSLWPGAAGGSGGGGGGNGTGQNGSGGAGTTGQGKAGGSGFGSSTSTQRASGGGGGAGVVGGNASSGVAGNGGNGLANTIAGSSVLYAGGGGGGTRDGTVGTGGLGGGGTGGRGTTNPVVGTNGADGLGGGGGGRGSSLDATNGGSGIVIVRYQGSPAGTGGTVTSGSGTAAGYTLHTFNAVGSTALDLSGLNLNQRLGLTLTSGITGDGDLTFDGPGRLTLQGANTFSGTTTIRQGTLALATGGSFANSPRIVVGDAGSSGAVLDLTAKTGTFAFTGSQTVGGIGTIRMDAGDTAQFAGTFAPGNSPGIVTFDGGTALLSGTTQIEIFGATRGTGYDAIDLINNATLDYGNGVLALDFGSWLADQQSYQLFGSGSSTLLGDFSSVTIAGTNYTGLTFTGSNGVWTSQGTSPAGQTLTFTEATGVLVIVPEPGAIALAGIGIGLAGWAAARRRRLAS
ncbi:MAG: PEP-CTERM sorting domain-containing protein [Planctomycetia bacterium]|nr:PEP-CTERM sorting domain-containing protein [Planctomycetia bacterium]